MKITNITKEYYEVDGMTNTQSHAKRELDILIKTTPDAIIRHFIPEILALCEVFGNSGQSGGSAPYTAGALTDAIKKLCLQQPTANSCCGSGGLSVGTPSATENRSASL